MSSGTKTTAAFVREEVGNFMQFAGAEQAKPNSVFIAVMGITGSGKSSFIRAVTGRDDVQVGHELMSCTNSVGIFRCAMGEYNVYFIDTPGFDDTNLADLDILKTVSNFLSVAYSNRKCLSGLVYMHQIADTRLGRTKKLNLDMLKALCGQDAFSNVAVLTSMWSTDRASAEFEKQVVREEQLRTEYLADILAAGGQLRRVQSRGDGTAMDAASARDVFAGLFDAWKSDTVTLRIQDELVNDGICLHETAAGQVLSAHLDGMRQQYEAEMAQLRGDAGDEGDAAAPRDEDKAALLEQQAVFQSSLDQFRADQEAMKVSLLEVYAEEKERFTTQIAALETSLREELASRKQEQAIREQVLAEMRVSVLQGNDPLSIQPKEASTATETKTETETADQEIRDGFVAEYARLVHGGTWHEEGYVEELRETREYVKALEKDIEEAMDEAEKAKGAWIMPLVHGALIVAGYFCEIQ